MSTQETYTFNQLKESARCNAVKEYLIVWEETNASGLNMTDALLILQDDSTTLYNEDGEFYDYI